MEELSTLTPVSEELELVGRAFHSSRNLCMSMRGYAELIQSHPDAADRHGEWAAKIIRQLDRLSDLYTNVERAWSRPGAQTQWVPAALLLRTADLVRAMAALVENAFEAAPPASEVGIRVMTATEGRWRIEILDEGPGIPREIEPRVSEAFFSRKPGHVGLGLYLSRTVLERHGCALRIQPALPSGTCAQILPREHFPGGDR
jgi:K+-sensing histidine kinase KdpD